MTNYVPLYSSSVSAGFPSPADDFVDRELNLHRHLVKHPTATFFVRVAGDSMIGAGIFPGDVLVVDRSVTPKSGHIVIAIVEGAFTVKRLQQTIKGFQLVPENSHYSPISLTENGPNEIWGVVVGVARKLR